MKRRDRQLLALRRVQAQIEAAEASEFGGLRYFHDGVTTKAEPAVLIRIADARMLLKGTQKEIGR